MSITDELREWAKTLIHWWCDPVKDEYTYTTGIMPPSIDAIRLDSNIIAIADRIDAEHERAVRYERCAFWHDASDDELAKYGLLRAPIDADGEPWHIGDRTESGQTIEAMGLNKHGWYFVGTVNEIDPAIHHHHAPTVEDVLREFAEKITDSQIPGVHPTYEEAIAEYAAKLQLREDA